MLLNKYAPIKKKTLRQNHTRFFSKKHFYKQR